MLNIYSKEFNYFERFKCIDNLEAIKSMSKLKEIKSDLEESIKKLDAEIAKASIKDLSSEEILSIYGNEISKVKYYEALGEIRYQLSIQKNRVCERTYCLKRQNLNISKLALNSGGVYTDVREDYPHRSYNRKRYGMSGITL
ncbi:hypothetical protein M2146_001169 [Lachnospiraceae bacterium PF1-22]